MPPVRLGLSGGNSGEIPERPRRAFPGIPLESTAGSPKPYNSRRLGLPEHFQNCLPLSSAGTPFLRIGSGEALSELLMEFPAVLRVFLNFGTGPKPPHVYLGKGLSKLPEPTHSRNAANTGVRRLIFAIQTRVFFENCCVKAWSQLVFCVFCFSELVTLSFIIFFLTSHNPVKRPFLRKKMQKMFQKPNNNRVSGGCPFSEASKSWFTNCKLVCHKKRHF